MVRVAQGCMSLGRVLGKMWMGLNGDLAAPSSRGAVLKPSGMVNWHPATEPFGTLWKVQVWCNYDSDVFLGFVFQVIFYGLYHGPWQIRIKVQLPEYFWNPSQAFLKQIQDFEVQNLSVIIFCNLKAFLSDIHRETKHDLSMDVWNFFKVNFLCWFHGNLPANLVLIFLVHLSSNEKAPVV